MNLFSLLPSETDFLANMRTVHRVGRYNEDEMLKRLRAKCFFDLAPPIPPALQRNEVLPNTQPRFDETGAHAAGRLRPVGSSV
jgi:hypothetical protein